jgi:hypothetical protein
VFHVAHHATHHTITDTNKSLTKATATATASKQEALEEHYRPSTHAQPGDEIFLRYIWKRLAIA